MPTTRFVAPENTNPPPALPLPSAGGARTLVQLEALARKLAGEIVAPDELAPCDRPKE